MATSLKNGQESEKLNILMRSFHTLNGLYDSNNSGKQPRRAKTFHHKESHLLKSQVKTSENQAKLENGIPKPVPPLAQTKGRKTSLKKSSNHVKTQGNDKAKLREHLKAKLHAGRGIGVSVFKLKESAAKENVMQSIPQDDFKYSYHNPLKSVKNEASLYDDALESSRKYSIANGGSEERMRVSQHQNIHNGTYTHQKPVSSIVRDIRFNLNRAMEPLNALRNRRKMRLESDRDNSFVDFRYALHHDDDLSDIRTLVKNPIYPKEIFSKVTDVSTNHDFEMRKTEQDFQVPKSPFQFSTRQSSESQMCESKHSHSSESENGPKKPKLGQRHLSRVGRIAPTASLVDMTPQPVMIRHISAGREEHYKQSYVTNSMPNITEHHAEPDCNAIEMKPLAFSSIVENELIVKKSECVEQRDCISRISSVDYMEKVPNDVNTPPTAADPKSVMSAKNYYTTYSKSNKHTSFSSSRNTVSRESRKSQSRRNCRDICDEAVKEKLLSPAPQSTRSPTPTALSTRSSPEHKRNLQKLQKEVSRNDTMKTKDRLADLRIQRKAVAMKQGRLKAKKKACGLESETIVQGYSCRQNKDQISDSDTDQDIPISPKGEAWEEGGGTHQQENTNSATISALRAVENIHPQNSKMSVANLSPKTPRFEPFEGLVIKSKFPSNLEKESKVDHVDNLSTASYPTGAMKPPGKLAPLMKVREVQKCKYILARTSGTEDSVRESPVKPISDPIIFTIRHPVQDPKLKPKHGHDKEHLLRSEKKSIKTEFTNSRMSAEHLIPAGLNGLHQGKNDKTVLVFFHNIARKQNKNDPSPRPRYGIIYKKTLKAMDEETFDASKDKPTVRNSYLPPKTLRMFDSNERDISSSDMHASDGETEDKNFAAKRRNRLGGRGRARYISKLQKIGIKTTAGGGFRSNAAHYSMLFRQQQQLKQDQEVFMKLMQEQYLQRHQPDCEYDIFDKVPNLESVKTTESLDCGDYKASSLPTKFSRDHSLRSTGTSNDTRRTSYTMLASSYPLIEDNSAQYQVQQYGPQHKACKSDQSMQRHYVWSDQNGKLSLPFGPVSQPPVLPIKSRSTNSETSSSVSITDLNFGKKSDHASINLVPIYRRASIPSKIHETLALGDEFDLIKLESRFATLPGIFEKPIPVKYNSKEGDLEYNHDNIEAFSEIPDEFATVSASILPDTGTTSYRLTHDVSFDEGSRYRTTGDYPHSLKKSDDIKGSHISTNGITSQFGSTASARANGSFGSAIQMRHEGRSSSRKEQIISLKETVPLSLVRLEERFGSDLPTAASPSSPAMSSTIAATTTVPAFIPPPSASRSQNPSSVNSGGNTITTFRFHKEKHNWNYRLGDLAINGGGYYSSSTLHPNGRQEINPSLSVNSSSVNQQSLQTRERTALGTKSRMSSRYSSKYDSGNTTSSFSDPCISAPASFQQRLTDLSILESETIKYERNRKLRRKKNQDKDS